MKGEKETYKNVVLVTGGAGFIGSAFLNLFVPMRPKMLFVNIDALTYAGDLTNIAVSQRENYRFVQCDIRQKQKLQAVFERFRPSAVIHFAAESHVDISIRRPDIFIETNVVGTHNLLKYAKHFAVRRFHFVSTDEVYGALESLAEPAFTETSSIAPNNPYSASKAAAEAIVRAYGKTHMMDVVITRGSNTYGPGQDKSKIVPLFMHRLLSERKVPLYSRGEHIRDWLYVDDHARAVDLVFRRGRQGEAYNVGGGCELSNRDMTGKILQLFGKDDSHIEYTKDRPGHDFRYALDTKKISTELGWVPKVTLEEGLLKTQHYWSKKIHDSNVGISYQRSHTRATVL